MLIYLLSQVNAPSLLGSSRLHEWANDLQCALSRTAHIRQSSYSPAHVLISSGLNIVYHWSSTSADSFNKYLQHTAFNGVVSSFVLIFYFVVRQGHYGQVFRGTYKGSICAIKKLRNCDSDSIERDKELEQEFEIMSKLDHLSIVKLFGRCRPLRNEEQCGSYKQIICLSCD